MSWPFAGPPNPGILPIGRKLEWVPACEQWGLLPDRARASAKSLAGQQVWLVKQKIILFRVSGIQGTQPRNLVSEMRAVGSEDSPGSGYVTGKHKNPKHFAYLTELSPTGPWSGDYFYFTDKEVSAWIK